MASYSLEYEALLASRWAGYRWESFREMEGEDQAVIIAAYRIENRISALEYKRLSRKKPNV